MSLGTTTSLEHTVPVLVVNAAGKLEVVPETLRSRKFADGADAVLIRMKNLLNN